jgi:hypothetical protein
MSRRGETAPYERAAWIALKGSGFFDAGEEGPMFSDLPYFKPVPK